MNHSTDNLTFQPNIFTNVIKDISDAEVLRHRDVNLILLGKNLETFDPIKLKQYQ